MATFNSNNMPEAPMPPNVANARAAIMANLEAKWAGKALKDVPNIPLNGPPQPQNLAAAQPKMELAPPEPEPEQVVADEPMEAQEEPAPEPAPQQAAATPAPAPKTRLSRSMDIQRRAEAAARAAREAAQKLRQPQEPEPTQARSPSIETQAALEQAKLQIATLKGQYDAAVRHLKDDPLGFAKAHGVDPANLAAYVASGADPNARAIENMRREFDRRVADVENKANQRIAALQDNFVAAQEVTAQQNFFQFVEETKAANPEAFAALASDLVFSPADVWNTANRILESRPDLQKNFDEDKLLEAVEAEARKDPRWNRVKALNEKTKQQQSNATPSQNKPNVSEKVEAAPAPKPAPRPTPRRDPASGQFQQTTPMQRHKDHVDRITSRVRILGG